MAASLGLMIRSLRRLDGALPEQQYPLPSWQNPHQPQDGKPPNPRRAPAADSQPDGPTAVAWRLEAQHTGQSQFNEITYRNARVLQLRPHLEALVNQGRDQPHIAG